MQVLKKQLFVVPQRISSIKIVAMYNLLSFRREVTQIYNQYHCNGVLSQEYDAPLFQLTVEDVMKNVILKESMVPYDLVHMEEEIGHGMFILHLDY